MERETLDSLRQLTRSRTPGTRMEVSPAMTRTSQEYDVNTIHEYANHNFSLLPSLIIPQGDLRLTEQAQIVSANQFYVPKDFTVSVVSNASVGAAVSTRVYILQQTDLNNVTNNGDGAGTISYTYQDTFAGKLISKAVSLARAGVGAVCFGVQLSMVVTATGVASTSGLSAAAAYFATFDASNGLPVPLNFNTAANRSRSDNDLSLNVERTAQNLSALTQFSFVIPPGVTASTTFYMTDNFRY